MIDSRMCNVVIASIVVYTEYSFDLSLSSSIQEKKSGIPLDVMSSGIMRCFQPMKYNNVLVNQFVFSVYA